MCTSLLHLQAGPEALEHCQENGLNMADFGYMLAASGGPKWLVLSGLDKYLCQQQRQAMLGINGLGTSAGAFRLACYARKDASHAIDEFAKQYIGTTYSGPHPRQPERDNSVKQILDTIVVGQEEEILASEFMRPHWITAQCHGLGSLPGQLPQVANLLASMVANRLGRKHFKHLYSRACFGPANSQLSIHDPYNLPTHYHQLTLENLYDSLLASGTIPLFSPLRQNVKGAFGSHLDGGLVDYHFDLQLQAADRKDKPLILYPHFTAKPRAGWFDKKLQRPPTANSYSKVLLITPSDEFLSRLKNGQIPERNDFKVYDDTTRQTAWQHAADLSKALADELHEIIEKQDMSRIAPLQLT